MTEARKESITGLKTKGVKGMEAGPTISYESSWGC